MLKRLAVLIFLVSLLACSRQQTVVTKDKNNTILEKYTIDGDSLKQGVYQAFNTRGELKEEAQYTNGKLDGIRILYSDGIKEIVEHYLDGVMHGPYQVYYPTGELLLEQNYNMGTLEGESLKYYENGQVEEKVIFVENQENGPFKEYHENGQLHWEGNYLNGDNEFGELKEYDSSGTLIKKMICDSLAVCRTVWTSEEGDIIPKY